MLVCVLASRKGRCGKTTLASHLAVEAGRAGAGSVAVVGLDPMGGLSGWWDARHAAEPMLPRVETSLADTLKVLREGGIQAVFVDTPPSVGPEVATAIALADIVLVPCKPSPDDLRAVGRTVEAVTLAGKPMVFAINMTKPRTRHTAEAAVALSQLAGWLLMRTPTPGWSLRPASATHGACQDAHAAQRTGFTVPEKRLPTFHLEAEIDARDRVVVCEHDIRRILAKREFKAGVRWRVASDGQHEVGYGRLQIDHLDITGD